MRLEKCKLLIDYANVMIMATDKELAFYERLCEGARKWTDLNLDDEANKVNSQCPISGKSQRG